MSLASSWDYLYKNVMINDRDSQLGYLSLISEKVREIPKEALISEQALFIPNDDYISYYGDELIIFDENGFYSGGNSIWTDYVIFPIRGLDNAAKGLGGFSPRLYLTAKETNDYSIAYYSYSTKRIFNKGAYLFWGLDGFEKAYTAGYVILVDGMFDAINLRRLGFNAAALMGSSLTEIIISQLRFFKKVIIVSDNDDAGNKLENRLKKQLHNCAYLRQSFDKDVDGAIKAGFSKEIISELNKMIAEPMILDHVIR
jgi:5S rRNA maturation endonuclease (ribonuclease M5)